MYTALMIRLGTIIFAVFVLLWAPWMDTSGTDEIAAQVFELFGPTASTCYDSEGNLLQDGIEVHWYPLGREIHTCSGDYVVWMWGSVKEQGGVYKKSTELQPVQSKALACVDVMERQLGRVSTTTEYNIPLYEGEYAQVPDFSIFEEGEEFKRVITASLKKGPTFAGKFAVAEWGCGSTCQQHAVIDVESGLVVGYGPQTEYGIEYSVESPILVTNPMSKLPALPNSSYELEGLALSLARVPREYYRLTTDALSGTQYLVLECIENAAIGFIEVEDERLGVINGEREEQN